MTRKDWALLAISSTGNDYLSPLQLQKALFLLKENKPSAVDRDFYQFIPYNYGPFCQDIYSDTELLASEGLIRFIHAIGQRWMGYSLTDKGKEYVKTLKQNVSKEDFEYLCNIVDWIKKLTFKQLLSVIYKRYPKYKENSIFSER